MSEVKSEHAAQYSVAPQAKSTRDLNDAELVAHCAGLDYDAARDALAASGGLAALEHSMPAMADIMELARRTLTDEIMHGPALTSPTDSGKFFRARLHHLPYEVFVCLYLDNRHRVLAFEELFRGTIDGANVYPREVVRACLKRNAAAVIFAHNHPSGVAEPSGADRDITQRLREALRLIDVRVLDHLVIGSGAPVSMAARGLI